MMIILMMKLLPPLIFALIIPLPSGDTVAPVVELICLSLNTKLRATLNSFVPFKLYFVVKHSPCCTSDGKRETSNHLPVNCKQNRIKYGQMNRCFTFVL